MSQRNGDRCTPRDLDLSGIRRQLVNDLREDRVDRFLIALARHDARLWKLLRSDTEVLLGEGATRGKEFEHPNQSFLPAWWAVEFLGGRMTPFLSAELQDPC
jgi:hypothetical protein